MSTPYWGQLPPPKITRGNSLKRPENRSNPPEDLTINTDTGGRYPAPIQPQYPVQSQPARQNRYSTQTTHTDAPTVSTQSPFASPTASSFRGDGLAPRPPSFGYGAGDKDYLEKRRRRESRNKEFYDDPSSIPPPAAPDAPKPPPPVSYKQPYSNGGSQSARRSSGPVASSRDRPEEYYRSSQRGQYPVDDRQGTARRSSKGKAAERNGDVEWDRSQPERLDTRQPRKASLSEAEEKRRREWAPDRSPLQRLELTLDSITKEEKRARVEEAELLARETKAGRGGDRAAQNSVRFRNRPVVKATPESVSQPEPQSLPEAGLVRNLSNRQRDQLQQSGTVETRRPVQPEMSPVNLARGFDYQPKPEVLPDPKKPEDVSSQRRPSTRDRSAIPIAAGVTGAVVASGLGRSGSNKLKKDPPGDPWFNRRADAEKAYQEVTPRKLSVDKGKAPMGVPSRGTAFGSHPQAVREKELPTVPTAGGRAPQYPEDLDFDDELDETPVRRGSSRKIEQLTGQNAPSQAHGSNVPAQQPMYADRRGTLAPSTSTNRQPSKEVRTELVTVNGIKYTIPPAVAGGISSGSRQDDEGHHHLSNLLHHGRHENGPGAGVYVPSRRLDEWKKGGVALLAGELLDLGVPEQTEAEKDKAWWEAGNSGKRRRSSTKQRKAEAYDGEYDDTNGTVPHFPESFDESESEFESECEGCVSEQNTHGSWLARHSRPCKPPSPPKGPPPRLRRTIHEKTKGRELISQAPDTSGAFLNPLSLPLRFPSSSLANLMPCRSCLKPHKLTCPTRPIRVRPDIAPTRFKPPLFLKSGPLLRYCGLRSETLQGRSARSASASKREIWRGSVMIVTEDSKSSYELAPTLRLFLQPLTLLPPPPAQVDGEMDTLAPEYVDPIAGLPKVGRDGRTLYIRPVDHLEEERDLSMEESDGGLFETTRSPLDGASDAKRNACQKSHYDGERAGKYKEIRGFRLHAENGVTFWKFNLEVELRDAQQRIAYRINRGPATGFWVPARDEAMNIMFHSCNGFSHDIDSNQFNGPDPLWRDVLNTHQTQPFHVMLGGGDQVYMDRVMEDTTLFREWTEIKEHHHKEHVPFTPELQQELETFYLDRYCMWFSQGLFGVANSQIPMINIHDDHDIIDGYGSYPDSYMRCPVFSGLGAVAFKYYMLFQHQTSIDEGEDTEPSWILGTEPGPYIPELSRSIFTFLGRSIAFLGLDCRTERMNDEIVSVETYEKVLSRLEKDIVKGQTKHLIVLLGIPIAYPRMVWLENMQVLCTQERKAALTLPSLTSRLMNPVKALGRAGLLGKSLLNHLDGGVEILDDLDDHWTARHHKDERNWLIQELQNIAAEKSVRITILGGDVHLGAIGQFYSNPKLKVPKDRDHRYMPNVISSAIVNAPPPDTLADMLNSRNKVHHLDAETDEDMIPIFTHDVNGKPRNNKRLLNRRNWCSIRLYDPETDPPPSPEESYDGSPSPPPTRRGILRRLSTTARGPSYRPDAVGPPLSNAGGFFSRRPSVDRRGSTDSERPSVLTRTLSLTRRDFLPTSLFRRSSKRKPDDGGINGYGAESDDDDVYYDQQSQQNARSGLRGGGAEEPSYFPGMAAPTGREISHPVEHAPTSVAGGNAQQGPPGRSQFHRTPTGFSEKQRRQGAPEVNLEGGLDICLNFEVNHKDPAGITMPYRLLVPALWYAEIDDGEAARNVGMGLKRWVSFARRKGDGSRLADFGKTGSNRDVNE